jgi:hypothetical protein
LPQKDKIIIFIRSPIIFIRNINKRCGNISFINIYISTEYPAFIILEKLQKIALDKKHNIIVSYYVSIVLNVNLIF